MRVPDSFLARIMSINVPLSTRVLTPGVARRPRAKIGTPRLRLRGSAVGTGREDPLILH